MSTLKEIQEAIPTLSLEEIAVLRKSLDHLLISERLNLLEKSARSIRDLRPLTGRWTGEAILKSADLAEEMFDRA